MTASLINCLTIIVCWHSIKEVMAKLNGQMITPGCGGSKASKDSLMPSVWRRSTLSATHWEERWPAGLQVYTRTG
jgi:hypothetical protein